MFALSKKDYLFYGPVSYCLFILLIIALTLIDLPAVFVMVFGVLAFALSPFLYDEKDDTNQFIISLPVSNQTIVTSRYIYSLFVLIAVIVIQLLANTLAGLIPVFAPTNYGFPDFLLFFCIGLGMIALFYPILYLFKNSYLAMPVVLILVLVGTFFTLQVLFNILEISHTFVLNGIDKGFVLLARKYIPFQPYLVTVFLAAALFLGSMKLSVLIFKKKDG